MVYFDASNTRYWTDYVYDDNNELVTETYNYRKNKNKIISTVTAYTYDTDGDLVTKNVGGSEIWQYLWTAESRLEAVTKGGTLLIYADDPDLYYKHKAIADKGTEILTAGVGALNAINNAKVNPIQSADPTDFDNAPDFCPDPPNQCFIAGTLVLTTEGLKAIEEIEVGDTVIATDPETGETEEKEVLHTFENETDELVHLTVNGEEITCTPGHKFYAPEKGWTSAVDLRAGDILQLVNGEYVTVEAVQHEILESPETIYNFEVEDFHTYYVGAHGVLVHNMDCFNNEGRKKYYQVTSKENAQNLINSDNPALTGIEFDEVYAWREQPTLSQARNSGARSLDTVIEFETNASFSADTSIVDSSLHNIAVVSDRPGPISITNVREVGFRKETIWQKIWKKLNS